MREYRKPPLGVDEQIELLRKRGMAIGDPAQARETLSRISYYRLSAYWYPMRVSSTCDRFKAGASFAEVVRLYEFDRRLRLLVLAGIEPVEVRFRAVLIDEIAHTYGALGHRSNEIARDQRRQAEWLNRLDEEVERSREVFLRHYRTNYLGFPRVPIWMALEVASLGILSHLYEGSVTSLQAKVSQKLSIPRPTVSKSWFHSLTYVRNICAHHARLWNREFAIAPKLPEREPAWRALQPKRVYAVMAVIQRVLQPTSVSSEWSHSVRELLLEAKPEWRRGMGVPEDWDKRGFFAY